ERRRLVVEQALHGPEISMDGRAPGARPVVVEQAQGELLERRSRGPAQQVLPQARPVAREAAERPEMRMPRDAEPIACAPARWMADEPQEAHEREEGLARDFARAKCAVKLERGERLRRGGQA